MNKTAHENKSFDICLFYGLCSIALVVFMCAIASHDRYYFFLARESVAVFLTQIVGITIGVVMIFKPAAVRVVWGNIFLGMFIVSAVVSSAFASDKTLALYRVGLYYSWFLVALAAMLAFNSRQRFSTFALWMGSIGVIVAVVGLAEKYLSFSLVNHIPINEQISSLLEYPTIYSGYLLCMIFILKAGIIVSGKNDRIILVIMLAFIFTNLWLAGSFAALSIVLAIDAGVLCVWAIKRRPGYLKPLATVALLILFISAHNIMPGPAKSEYANKKIKSINMRMGGWSIIAPMYRAHPLFGFGPDQFGIMLPRYRANRHNVLKAWDHPLFWYYPSNSENLFFTIAVEQGCVGLIFFFLIILFTLFSAFFGLKGLEKWRRNILICMGLGSMGFLVYSQFHMPIFSSGVWPLYWTSIGMIWGTRYSSDKVEWPHIQLPRFIEHAAAITIIMLSIGYMYMFIGRWANDLSLYKVRKMAVQSDIHTINDCNNGMIPFVPKSWRYYLGYSDCVGALDRKESIRILKEAEKRNPYSLFIYFSIIQHLNIDREANKHEIEIYMKKACDLNSDYCEAAPVQHLDG